MKYSSLLLGSLLLTGSALSIHCFAQDEAPDPVPQAPPAPSRPARPVPNVDEGQITARVREALRTAEGELQRVQVQTPSYYFLGQSSPEMARKTREITVLRQMVALKLSARDLERAIPLLKQLRDTDKAVPIKPEQALDEEYNALLHAKPGDPMPPSSATALRDASRTHREEKQAIWESMQKAIGKDKATGIRQMVSSERYTSFSPFSTTALAPLAWSSRSNITITGPDGKVIERRRAPLALQPAAPQDSDVVPAVPVTPVPPADNAPTAPRRKIKRGDAAPTDATPDTRWSNRGAAAQRTLSGVDSDLTNRMNNLFVFNSGQVSLDELIALMEKKLAAMR